MKVFFYAAALLLKTASTPESFSDAASFFLDEHKHNKYDRDDKLRD